MPTHAAIRSVAVLGPPQWHVVVSERGSMTTNEEVEAEAGWWLR